MDMVLCFECSVDLKRNIDRLLGSGKYSDLSELIAVAVSNQVLLQDHAAQDGTVVFGAAPKPTPQQAPEPLAPTELAEQPLELSKRRVNGISMLFTHRPTEPSGPVAELPADPSADPTGVIRPSLWIFGQYNRLLPAKASCRALANLLQEGRGIEATGAAKKIAAEATELGNYLRILDRRQGHGRDEMFCIAFPGDVDPDKGRLRYANQFVVSVDRNGQLSGLLVDLKLINQVSAREPRISLTDAGWRFALLPNPLLDAIDDDHVRDRFTAEERNFLLDHIAASVPRERHAYLTILAAIAGGHDTPDAISAVMKELEQAPQESDSLLATQRSGAISRMSDLALLSRDREGIRVRYRISPDGDRFLKSH